MSRGGAEQIVETIATELERRGDEISVIALRPWGKRVSSSGTRRVYYLGSGYGHLSRLPWAVRLSWHAGLFYNPVKYLQLRRILDQERPDVVLTHNLTGFGFSILRLFARHRHIHTVHDIQLLHPSGLLMYGQERMIDSRAARMYQRLIAKAFPRSSRIIFPSMWLEQLHLSRDMFSANQRRVLQNPILLDRHRDRTSSGKGFRFLYVGQLEQHKGVMLLLRAFSQLGGDVRLTVVGEGSLLAECRAKYGETIEFAGRLPHEKIRSAMAAADCLVVPSLCYENLPTVILEAQAVGLPVIASNLGGIPELLPEECVFAPEEKALGQALESAVRNSPTSVPAPFLVSPADYVTQILDSISE